MHAQHSASTPYARNTPFVHFKSAQRRENRLQYRAQVAALCEQLANADLSATALRLALNTLARLIRRGSTTEAMPAAVIAEQLGVHRNAISAGYASLEAAGILKRIAVKHRGAPTRTRLVGRAAEVIGGKTHTTTGTEECGANIEHTPAHPGPISADDTLPSIVLSTNETHAEQSPGMDEVASPISCTTAFTITAEESAARKEGDESAPEESVVASGGAGRFVFDKAVNDAMIAKVPSEIRQMAMRARKPSDLRIDLAWGLTEREVEHFRALVPKPEKPLAVRPRHTEAKSLPLAGKDVTDALSYLMPRLEKAAGSTAQAFAVADQIAYSVIAKGLGQGNALAGVRAAVKMVEGKRWGEPRGFAAERDHWSGITMRSLVCATPSRTGHAQNSVH
ncbi:MAG: hypothetical protein B7X33_00010 [Lysobacterales bacterium 13-68-4]|jgi:DNA-binding Lrp family transcriptional regulator|nr:MAG: hypothetical protein B7X33_00010 [Xanthomonadales bacterium 13-68-4]